MRAACREIPVRMREMKLLLQFIGLETYLFIYFLFYMKEPSSLSVRFGIEQNKPIDS